MLRSTLNGGNDWPNAHRIWAKLCNSADVNLRERLFTELLTWSIQINNGDQSGIFWRVLLNRIKITEEFDACIQRITDNIEVVEMNSNDLAYTFGRERFYSKIISKLPDRLVLDVLGITKGFGSNLEIETGTLELLDAIYQKVTPRLSRIHEMVIQHAQAHHGSAEFISSVQASRTRTIELASDQRKKFDDVHPDKLPGWTSWRKND
jgi:hypothetical protein